MACRVVPPVSGNPAGGWLSATTSTDRKTAAIATTTTACPPARRTSASWSSRCRRSSRARCMATSRRIRCAVAVIECCPRRGVTTKKGIASFYGNKFHGYKTSSLETYDMYAFSAASTTLPLPSYARVTNLSNGKSVIVRVNDRGPFHDNRLIDLSFAAAVKIGIWPKGTGLVEVVGIDPSDPSPELARTPVVPDCAPGHFPADRGFFRRRQRAAAGAAPARGEPGRGAGERGGGQRPAHPPRARRTRCRT